MAYFKLDKLPDKERMRLLGEFYSLAGQIKNRDEAKFIMRDLLTGNEIGNLMRRIDVAICLWAGCTHDEIMRLLDVGKTKIRNVERKLKSKDGGEGYRLMVERVVSLRKKRKVKIRKIELKEARKGERPDIEFMKNKYQGVFGVFNVIDEISDYLIIKSENKNTDPKQEVMEDYKDFKKE